jgi:DNA-directed RNA polymerase sigma subunit (sigma70/sigma32)
LAKTLEDAAIAYAASLPVLSGESGLTRYLEEIRRFPMLEPHEEYVLAKRWGEHGDREACVIGLSRKSNCIAAHSVTDEMP